MHRAVVIFAFLCSFALAPANAQHSSSHSSHSSKASKSHASKSKSTKDKSVHVRGYTRKNGTYVAPYDRSAPGTAGPTSSSSIGTPHTYRKDYVAQGYAPHSSVQRDQHGKIKRSSAAKSAFERQAPCPSTGKTSGACRGYVVDHVQALECGGADAPSNMQWQTTADAKAKDKTERRCR
jgi:hypothetical protein